MNERIINLSSVNPVDIYGINDRNINLIKSHFPKLKIIARGDVVKAIGNDADLAEFEEKFGLLLVNYEQFGTLSELDIEQILTDNDPSMGMKENGNGGDVL